MNEVISPYACDDCRSRKLACSRERPKCQRCKDRNVTCAYSRSGVIRRNRKRNRGISLLNSIDPDHEINAGSSRTKSNGVLPHLEPDIAMTRERLGKLDSWQYNPLGALSSLSEACAAVWHEETEFENGSNRFFLFEDEAASWIDLFVTSLAQGPMSINAPTEVLDHLRARRPHQIRESAWLVMFYSIILSHVSSTDRMNHAIKKKLRCNLWIALNDVRLFLEPSEANIHALTLLACHIEEFTTPSLCWMLSTTACRMLQALGVNHRRLDQQTRERRVMMFWHMNLLDKGLALIFGRPPTFHRSMVREIPLPTLDQLLPSRASGDAPGMFSTHHFHQRLLLTTVMTDVWNSLYEDAADDHRIGAVINDLDAWYRQARQLLDAAALAEKPFLDLSGVNSTDLGLHSLHFTYLYLHVLLTRSSSQTRTQCIESSKHLLHLLDHMICEVEKQYIGLTWHLLCGPFTPFLELFGDIVSKPKDEREGSQEALTAMERLPVFLRKMSQRNSLAVKLEHIAVVFVQNATAAIYPQENPASEVTAGSSSKTPTLPDPWPVAGNMLHWDALFDYSMTPPTQSQGEVGIFEAQPFDMEAWTSDFFGDVVFDWIGSNSHV